VTRDLVTTPWKLDPRSTLRPDPRHWERASPELRSVALGQGLQGAQMGAWGRFVLRVRAIARALVTNEQPQLWVSKGER
jgi:hypothetical protein